MDEVIEMWKRHLDKCKDDEPKACRDAARAIMQLSELLYDFAVEQRYYYLFDAITSICKSIERQ